LLPATLHLLQPASLGGQAAPRESRRIAAQQRGDPTPARDAASRPRRGAGAVEEVKGIFGQIRQPSPKVKIILRADSVNGDPDYP